MKKVCLLTGASGKLGAAFCRRFAGDLDIVALYHSHLPKYPSRSFKYIDPIDPEKSKKHEDAMIYPVQCDLARAEEHQRIVDLALARFGRVDYLVHAAVHSVWADLPGSNRALKSFSKQLAVNTFAPLNLATILLRQEWMHAIDENRGANRNVIVISSTAAEKVYPERGQSVYACSKAALNVLAQHMASEFAPFSVRVNAILPDSFPEIISEDCILDVIWDTLHASCTGKLLHTPDV